MRISVRSVPGHWRRSLGEGASISSTSIERRSWEPSGRPPPHPEVPDALTRLRSAGYPMATLTNSSGKAARMQLDHAGVAGLFDHVLSVEEVGRYKPAR